MKRKRNLTIRKPFSGGRSLFGPGLIRTKKQKRVAAMVRKRRSAGLMSESEYKRLRKSTRASSPMEHRTKKQLEGLFHELYGRSENPGSLVRRIRNTFPPSRFVLRKIR